LHFNIPYFVLREDKELLKDSRKIQEGESLRKSWKLPSFPRATESTSTDTPYCLYEAKISVAVTGINDWVWTAYCFVDTYFGSSDRVDVYDQEKGEKGGRVDPLGAGYIDADGPADGPIQGPREYLGKVFEIRIKMIRKEWNAIVDKIEKDGAQ
jgi:hypothetical protein